jgi:orotidine-5'-phosphate decarboxylase
MVNAVLNVPIHKGGQIVNGIVDADKTENFATVAGQEAQKVQAQMEKIMCQ